MKYKIVALLLFAQFVKTFCYSTVLAVNDEYNINTYTTDEGISHNFVSSVIQDQNGFIWVGTHKGLNRFDGYAFKNFLNNPSDSTTIISVHVETLLCDRKGNIWVGTINGLDKFDVKTERFIHISELFPKTSLKGADIKSLFEDAKGNLWIGTYGKGLYYLDIARNKLTEFRTGKSNSISSDFINTIFQVSDDELWIGTWEAGLDCYNLKTKKWSNYVSVKKTGGHIDFTINSICSDKKGNLLISTWGNGLYIFNLKMRRYERPDFPENLLSSLSNKAITSTIIDKNGNFWFTTFDDGLYTFSPQTRRWQKFNSDQQKSFVIKSNMLWNVFEDKYGVVWVSTFGSGIVKIVKNNSAFKRAQDKTNINSINSINYIYQSRDKTLWVGMNNTGIYQYNRTNRTVEIPSKFDPRLNQLFNTNIMCYCEDRQNQLWMGTNKGVLVYNMKTGAAKSLDPSYLVEDSTIAPKEMSIISLCVDTFDNVWMGTFEAGLYRYNIKTGKCKRYFNSEKDSRSLSNNVVWSLLCDKQNNVWIGTRNMLNRYNRGNDNFIRYFPDSLNSNSISHHVISNLYLDSRGRIWIATLGGGINLYRRGTGDFARISKNEGLPDNSIFSITEDIKGCLWMSSIKGLTRYNPDNQIIVTYTKNTGLPDNHYNMAAGHSTSWGEVLFGGNEGLDVFYPDSIRDFIEQPPVVFTDFKLFNTSVPVNKVIDKRNILPVNINELDELRLKYSDNIVNIEFSILDYAFPPANQYAYKLEGFDKDWVYTDASRRYAYYTNLSPGTYTFRVKATNHNGIWTDSIKKLTLIIEPPFWQTVWFAFLVFIITVVLIYLIIRSRIKYYHKQREVLKQLVEKQTSEIAEQVLILRNQNEELSRQKEEIQEMNVRIQKAEERKSQFFTNISHEFRTPLTLIIGPAYNMVQHFKNDSYAKEQLVTIQKNANRLLRLVNELLDFNKLDSDKMRVRLVEGDLVKFVKEIKESFDDYADCKEIDFVFESNIEEFNTWFDAVKIEIILYNLISNAFKFTLSKGTIHLRIELDSRIKIEVKDTGIGIDPNKLEKIFDRFYQIEAESMHYQGSGIGLALTKDLVVLMDGEIRVESNINVGTVFFISLPVFNVSEVEKIEKFEIDTSDEPKLNSQLLNQYLLPENVFKPDDTQNIPDKKILVVDDNDDLRRFISLSLSDYYQVIEAENGHEGLIKARNELPNLIISDVMMPEIDGVTLCKELKTNIETSHIPVILLTAKTNIEAQIEGYAFGADDYITKPFNEDLLKIRIQNLIEARESLRKVFESKIEISPREITVTSPDEKFISKAIDIIERNIENIDFGAAELVNELKMSRTLVHIKFKELTGKSTGEFIKIYRLKRACQLLKHDKMRVSEVCFMVGFADPHYFSKIFKSVYGISPSEYAESV